MALILLVTLTGLLIFRLFFEKDAKEPLNIRKLEEIHLTQQQEADLPAWGKKIASLITEDLGEDLSRMHDYEAIVAVTLEGTDGDEVRRLLDRTMRLAVKYDAGGFLAEAAGHPAHFLRVGTRAGFPAITLRIDYENEQISYMDVLLQPAGNQFKIVDAYDYIKGARRTDDFRQIMAPILIAQNSKLISSWLDHWNLKMGDAEYLISLLKARRKGMEEDVLTVCDQAPEHMRNSRLVFFSRNHALQQLSITNPRYERLYFEFLKKPPPMPGTPHVLELLLVPKLIAEQDYQTADDAMEKVMSVIGEDAYLLCMRAEIKSLLMDKEAAKTLLRRAHELEPDLPLLKKLRHELRFPQNSEC